MCKKLTLKTDKFEINSEGYEISELINLLAAVKGDCSLPVVNSYEEELNTVKPIKSKNDVDVYDIDNIINNTRMPVTTTNFRCPSCGQGVIAISENGILLRNSRENFKLFQLPNGIILPEIDNTDDLINVYKDLLNIDGDITPVVLAKGNNDTECKCPICNETNKLDNWIEAFDTLNHFDTMHMCEICGDEAKIVVSNDGDTLLCQNKCIEKI